MKMAGMIGYVPQDVTILNDTLFRNIASDDASIKKGWIARQRSGNIILVEKGKFIKY